MLDTEDCRFEAVSDRAVRVSGMRWRPADTYTVKLEGVERAGFRAITICGTRDPLLIAGSMRSSPRCAATSPKRPPTSAPGRSNTS